MERTITKNNFQQEVLQSDIPVLVDFWAAWCGPCRMLAPILEEVAAETEGRVKVGKINVDEESELAAAFQVMSIPTLIVFKNGQAVRSAVGLQPKSNILALLED